MTSKIAASILLGLPTYNGTRENGVALLHAAHRNAVVMEMQSSALPYCFNRIWCHLLNHRGQYTHFIMLHADVRPDGLWIDDLVSELVLNDADIVSTIIPIKTEHGLTSVGFDEGDDWRPRRLTMAEVFERPLTWTAPNLVFNTGLWIARVDDWMEKVSFHFQDRIVRGPDGKFEAGFIPEDWDFARQVRMLGLRAFVTRRVPVVHVGTALYPNQYPWGTLDTDPGDRKLNTAKETL